MNALCKNGCWLLFAIFSCINSAFAADSIESSIAEISEKIVKDKDRVSQGSFIIGVTQVVTYRPATENQALVSR
jgi:hypothetical protein